MKPFGFQKSERLCSKKSIDEVFTQGTSVFAYPIKANYTVKTLCEGEPAVQALFVVPKKRFKRAVHRNALRRRMREAYRLNKHSLTQWCQNNNLQLRIAFMYVSSEQINFEQIQNAIVKLFLLIEKEQNKTITSSKP